MSLLSYTTIFFGQILFSFHQRATILTGSPWIWQWGALAKSSEVFHDRAFLPKFSKKNARSRSNIFFLLASSGEKLEYPSVSRGGSRIFQRGSPGHQPLRGVGAPTYYLTNFFPKTAWKWRNFGTEVERGLEGAQCPSPWDPDAVAIWTQSSVMHRCTDYVFFSENKVLITFWIRVGGSFLSTSLPVLQSERDAVSQLSHFSRSTLCVKFWEISSFLLWS